jgi:hypothetical protein
MLHFLENRPPGHVEHAPGDHFVELAGSVHAHDIDHPTEAHRLFLWL